MTKSEAIEALEIELNRWEADCKSYHAVKEALPMAIEALENENALIDRVLEIIDDALSVEETAIKAKWNQVRIVKQIKDRVLVLKGGEE